MSHTGPINERYLAAIRNNQIPNRMSLPNTHFVSNVLPGSTSSTVKKLRTVKKMFTPNEFTHFTKGFAGRELNPRTGLPVEGRGGKRRRRRRRRRRPLERKSKVVVGKRKKKKEKKL